MDEVRDKVWAGKISSGAQRVRVEKISAEPLGRRSRQGLRTGRQ